MRKVFLDELPRFENGCNKDRIDWGKCIGYKVRFIYDDDEGCIKIVDYKSNGQRLTVLYNGKDFEIKTCNFLKCKLGSIMGIKTKEFKIEIGQEINGLLIINRANKVDSKGRVLKSYKYKCNKCGFDCGEHYKNGEFKEELWINEGNLLKGQGCSCCSSRVTVSNINSIWKTDNYMIEKFGISIEDAKRFTRSSDNKITVICPECKKEKDKRIADIYADKTIGCECSDGFSYISKYITSILNQSKINYKKEVKYSWNKYTNKFKNIESQAYIDFVIHYNNREIPLEADGSFHRQDNKMNGQTKEMSRYIDKQRDENCLKYLGEETIRISDEGDIRQNVLNSKLNEIIDFNFINWKEADLYATKNIKIEVCKYKKENPSATTTEIGKVFKLALSTVREYLKWGNKNDYCYYDTEEESRKSSSRVGLSKAKQVEIFKNETSLGIFESCAELSRQSKERFGIKLLQEKISEVCNNNRKSHKGYTFKYVKIKA